MTRVLMSIDLLEYCEGMAELVRQVCEKPTITGVAPRGRNKEIFRVRKELPALRLDGLLRPPRIEVHCYVDAGHKKGNVVITVR